MNILFFVSSIGDTELALSTAKILRLQGYKTTFISLSKVAEDRVIAAGKLAPIAQYSLCDLLVLSPHGLPLKRCTNKQLARIEKFVTEQHFSHVYVGVPSERNNEIALQIAARIRHIPLLLASEFMFKPHPNHSIWQHLPRLKKNSNLHWGIPLKKTQSDLGLEIQPVHITGHLSIDRALQPVSYDTAALKRTLEMTDEEQSLVFMSSTTQPVACDIHFLKMILAELPNHPKIQIRLGLHPGIQDLDGYLMDMIKAYQESGSPKRFQIILPPSWRGKFKYPDTHLDNPDLKYLFVFQEISGPEAAAAADKVIQAVPGALLNEAAVRGKPVYTLLTEEEVPCLPIECFAQSPAILFRSKQAIRLDKCVLELSEDTAAQACAKAIIRP